MLINKALSKMPTVKGIHGRKRGEEEEGSGLRGGHVQSTLPNSRNGLM